MAELTLSSAVRNSLLSLQTTTQLIGRTQGRLSTGLAVASPVDDPVAFFQAKTLNDRAFDFREKKGAVDQGVSTVTAAIDGVNTIETLVRQLKGISNSLKSADATQLSDLVTQFNDLRTQIDNLAADASYQGTNLINGTGTTLGVEFSDKTASILNVISTDLRVATAGLSIGSAVQYTGNVVTYNASGGALSSDATYFNSANAAGSFTGFASYGLGADKNISLTWDGLNKTFTGGTVNFTYGTQTLAVTVAESAAVVYGDVISIDIATALAASTADFKILGATQFSNYDAISYASSTGADLTGGATTALADAVLLTYNGSNKDVTSATTVTFNYGSAAYTISFSGAVSGSEITATYGTSLTAGEVLTLYVLTAAARATSAFGALSAQLVLELGGGSAATAATLQASSYTGAVIGYQLAADITAVAKSVAQKVAVGNIDAVNTIITGLDSALAKLRTQASSLGSNVAVLQTRLDFTSNYVNTLESGASKLTLADLNSEGANLLALQTRQQLGIQALSFAGQAEQGILALFR